MDQNKQKEEFSNAFFQVLVARAGYNVSKPRVDEDCIDWTVLSTDHRHAKLDVQLKCTADDVLFPDALPFPLKVQYYNNLRLTQEERLSPIILVVVFVPNDITNWLEQTAEQLLLRRSAYWLSLSGMAETENASSVTVHIPTDQMLTPEALHGIMKRIAAGGLP